MRSAARAAPQRLHRLDANVSPYLYVGSFFLVFCAFGLFPLGYTAWMSLTDRNLLNPTTHFIGLDNYTALLHDSYFWNAVENTLGIWVLSTSRSSCSRSSLAHLLNTKLRGRTFFRMGVLLPQVTSLVAVALIFTQLFSRDYGLFNYLLGGVGIGPVDWEAGRFSSWIALSVMVTWRWTGYNALHLPRRHAGDPGRPLRVGGDRRRAAAGGSSATSRPDDPADDHLHGHHLDDRRAPALHRAVPLPAGQERRDGRLGAPVPDGRRCTCTRSRSAARSSSSATRRRSPGACSCSSP